jgi:hypothetical protein
MPFLYRDRWHAVCVALNCELLTGEIGDGDQVAFLIIAKLKEDNPAILADGSDVSSVTASNSLLALIRWWMPSGYRK